MAPYRWAFLDRPSRLRVLSGRAGVRGVCIWVLVLRNTHHVEKDGMEVQRTQSCFLYAVKKHIDLIEARQAFRSTARNRAAVTTNLLGSLLDRQLDSGEDTMDF
ncbi:hypothetical protein AOLI_G00211280 [Acnodon oligacanthus]